MKIIGFNFTKILAERSVDFKKVEPSINVEFTDLTKEKADILKEDEALKSNFKFSLLYKEANKQGDKKESNKQGEILFEGSVVFLAEKEQVKEALKSWKKKQIPSSISLPLLNFIMRKCSTKAISIQEDINLPLNFLKYPQIKAVNKEE